MTQPILLNVTEEIVSGLVRFLLYGPEYQTFCHCKQCELNIIAETLNHLQPKYVASDAERTRAFVVLNTPQNIETINKEIIHAIHKIGQSVGHTES